MNEPRNDRDYCAELVPQLDRLSAWRTEHAVNAAGTAEYDKSTVLHRFLTDLRERNGGTPQQREYVRQQIGEVAPPAVRRPLSERIGVIYFATDGEAIKIGFTTRLAARMSQLQSRTDRQLTVLDSFVAWEREEAMLHREFRPDRFGRKHEKEWYRRTPKLLSLIERLRTARHEIERRATTVAKIAEEHLHWNQ
jgi:hypothetical protein